MKILAPDKQPATRAVGKKLSVTLSSVEYQWEDIGNRLRLVVPAGFLFDGASIPWLLWSALRLAPHGVMDGPALAHDFIYHHQGKMPPGTYQLWTSRGWMDMSSPMPRDVADDLLAALVLHFKAGGKVKAGLVYAGVRAGGWLSWKRDDDSRKLREMDVVLSAEME